MNYEKRDIEISERSSVSSKQEAVASVTALIIFIVSSVIVCTMRSEILPSTLLESASYGYVPMLITPMHIGYLALLSISGGLSGLIYLLMVNCKIKS